jgi:hypothetical protein
MTTLLVIFVLALIAIGLENLFRSGPTSAVMKSRCYLEIAIIVFSSGTMLNEPKANLACIVFATG